MVSVVHRRELEGPEQAAERVGGKVWPCCWWGGGGGGGGEAGVRENDFHAVSGCGLCLLLQSLQSYTPGNVTTIAANQPFNATKNCYRDAVPCKSPGKRFLYHPVKHWDGSYSCASCSHSTFTVTLV